MTDKNENMKMLREFAEFHLNTYKNSLQEVIYRGREVLDLTEEQADLIDFTLDNFHKQFLSEVARAAAGRGDGK